MFGRKKTSLSKIFFISIFFFIFGFTLNSILSYGDLFSFWEGNKVTKIQTVVEKEAPLNLDLFWQVMSDVEKKYVHTEDINYENMIYGAIKGMVGSLNDPYTVFMDPEESKEFTDSIEGTLEGIGAELTLEDDSITIVTPLKNSPAEKAGLRPGDIIYKVNDEFTMDMTLFDVIMKIRGPKGTSVNLSILREKNKSPFDVSIVRDSIEIESISMEKLKNGIVYLSINQFNNKTTEEFNKTVSEMVLTPPKGVILDLRYNGGGYLTTSVEMLSVLLPDNTPAVKIRQRSVEDEILYTTGTPKLPDTPLVVLVNEGSASASEILAGAIKAHKRGIIMGTQTFGKGTVQEVSNYTDGSSIRMTIAKWLTPDDIDINKAGLTPDIIVEITDQDIKRKYDRQKEEAIKYLLSKKVK